MRQHPCAIVTHERGRADEHSPAAVRWIEQATAATGDARAALWSELFALLHDEIVSDVLLLHMVGFARVAESIDYTPTIATNSSLQSADIGLD
ncbi:hypothetical protein [Roseicyclus sp.]